MNKFELRVDAATNTLTISADFAKKASNIDSKEYRKLCEWRRDNPGLNIKQRTHDSGNRYTYADMKKALRNIDENGKLIESFNLVLEISKNEKAPYAYVYNWFKKQMNAAKNEKLNEKKAAAENNKQILQKELENLEKGISFKTSVADEDKELVEDNV